MATLLPMHAHHTLSAIRRAAERAGRNAERDVAKLYQAQGYTILAERLRTGAGEIDLVAATASDLVFVEVKARKSFFEAAHAISARQQMRLMEAASVALLSNPAWQRENTGFDVALVCPSGITRLPGAIHHN